MSVTQLRGDCRAILPTLEAESVHCVVTSPPYFGLRDYGTAKWEGGNPSCQHEGDGRYYTEKTAATSSAGAFSEAGEANAERLRKGRWRESGICVKCGAKHGDSQIGLEASPDAYIAELVAVFREVRRVLRDDGTLWLNLGDSYTGSASTGGVGKETAYTGQRKLAAKAGKPKDLLMIPARVALALQADGWWLRSDIIWHKPNPMPESVTDRPTSAHEHVFLLSRSERYWYDAAAVAEPLAAPEKEGRSATISLRYSEQSGRAGDSGLTNREPLASRNLRNLWTIATAPFADAHFATFPPALVEPCIKAGCPAGGAVLDPFGGAGTVGLVADRLQRNAILIELNPAYADMAEKRVWNDAPLLQEAK